MIIKIINRKYTFNYLRLNLKSATQARVRAAGSLHTFSKYVTHYDTFACAKCSGLCRGLKDKTLPPLAAVLSVGERFTHPCQHENQKKKQS